AFFPSAAGGGLVLGRILGVPGESVAHGMDFHLGAKAFQRFQFPRDPLPLDELDDRHAKPATQAPEHRSERRGRFTFALTRINDEQSAPGPLGGPAVFSGSEIGSFGHALRIEYFSPNFIDTPRSGIVKKM